LRTHLGQKKSKRQSSHFPSLKFEKKKKNRQQYEVATKNPGKQAEYYYFLNMVQYLQNRDGIVWKVFIYHDFHSVQIGDQGRKAKHML
jgi:hypothetical protein